MKPKDIAFLALGIALFVVLSMCLRVPVFENYYLCLGYIVMTVYIWCFKWYEGAVIGFLGVILYCIIGGLGFNGMPGWSVGNIAIGLIMGATLKYVQKVKNKTAQVAAMAPQYLGVRYVYGGASTSGFDCSGFTMWLYKQFGYSLPHTASGQYANCGYKVSRSELQPGDLVFFSSPGSGGSINHVGVYVGGGEIIHARYSVGQVYRNSLSENYYSTYYAGAIRIA